MAGKRRVASEEELLRLLEETYLELSAKKGWNPINCYHYSFKYSVCYGAPIFLGNRRVWRREPVKEGLFDVLNRKLKAMGYRPLTWEVFRELMRRIERQGVVWVNWLVAPNGQVEPHDMTIMKPTFLHGW
jgi:hypothetical protein